MTSADLLGWLLTYAAHSTLLLGFAWLASRSIQSHAIKDLLWKTALIGGLVTTSLQRSDIGSLGRYGFRLAMPGSVATAAPAATPASRAPLKLKTSSRKTTESSEVGITANQDAPVGVEGATQSTATGPSPISHLPSPIFFLAVWAVVAVGLVVRFIAARWRLASGFGRRAPVAEGTLTMMLAELRSVAGIRRRVRLTHSAGLASPVAFGVGEICLPDAVLTDLDIEQQHSVLAHELAHLARFDPLWLDLAGVLERVFFFQPLNIVARKRIQDGAEYLCDDWAVRRTGSGLTLAKCLVKVAEWMEGTPHAVPVSGMAEHRSQLVSRIHRLIGNHAMRTGPRPRWLVPASAVLLIATAAFAPGFSSGSTRNSTGLTPSVTGDEFAGVAADTDTVVTTTSRANRERAMVAALAEADRKAVTVDRMRTSELRAELAAKNHTMTYMAMDMKAAKLATTLSNGVIWNGRGKHSGDTNSVAVPALLEALKDPAVEVRRAAAQSLANLEDPRTVPGLIEALKDSDKEVRQSSAQGLGQLGDERAIDGLIGVMKDSDPEVRQAAVEALGELRSQKAIPGFTYALKDENKEVRRAAIQALGSLENPKPVDALIAALKDNDGDVREAAVNALDGTEDKRAVAPLMALLSDPVADVRQATCSALGSLRDPSAAQAISGLLKDSNADVRESCASALGSMELKSAPAGLLDALHDSKADVRQRAAETVGSIQDAKAVPGLKLLLDDANGDVREAAIDALSNIPDRTALDALIGALKSKDANVRKRAAEALGHREE